MDCHKSQQSFVCNTLLIFTCLAICIGTLFGAPPCFAEPHAVYELHAINAQGKDETFFDNSYSNGDGFTSVSTINTLSSVYIRDVRLLNLLTVCAEIVTIFWGLVLLIDALLQWHLRAKSHVHFLRGCMVTALGLLIPLIVNWVYTTGCQEHLF